MKNPFSLSNLRIPGLSMLLLTACLATALGQTSLPDSSANLSETAVYRGLRLSVFGFQIAAQTSRRLTLTCDLANTGRLPITFGKHRKAPPALLFEMDAQSLPPTLQGHEAWVEQALRAQTLSLQPGDVLQGIELQIPVGANAELTPMAAPETGPQNLTACSDLVFDTAYVERRTDKVMLLHFTLRNAGNAPARLLGKADQAQDNLGINAYFQRGERLTRGSVLAAGIFIELGRETLDGMLLPGQSLLGEMEIPLKARTQFNPNLLLELDPFQRVEECERRNNTRVLLLDF